LILIEDAEIVLAKHWATTLPQIDQIDQLQIRKDSLLHDSLVPTIVNGNVTIQKTYSNIKYIAVASHTSDSSPVNVLCLLNIIIATLHEYLSTITKEQITTHLDVVYMLLDEIVDHGYPYITDLSTLKLIVPPPTLINQVLNAVSLSTSSSASSRRKEAPTPQLSTVPWRHAGIKYASNEIFIDLVETLDAIIDANGKVRHAVVRGDVICISRLSGMPELLLNFQSHRIFVPDCVSLHHAISIPRWSKDGVLAFIPPDGKFKLMDYVIKVPTIPITVKSTISFSADGNGSIDILLHPSISSSKSIEDVALLTTLPPSTLSLKSNVNIGHVHFDSVSKQLRWNVGTIDFPVVGWPTMNVKVFGEASEGGVVKLDGGIHLAFRMNGTGVSGVQVDGLKVHHEAYKPFKGFKVISKTGKVQIRV